jgi:UDP-N-acetyl-D-mannosaminuronic acid dehydrogenase
MPERAEADERPPGTSAEAPGTAGWEGRSPRRSDPAMTRPLRLLEPVPDDPGPVAVIGLGYAGLTLAVGLADAGVPVVGVDVDPATRAALRAGRSPFYEPGLDEVLAALPPDRLTVADRLPDTPVSAIVICVGTPVDPGTRLLDVSALAAATRHAAEHADERTLVVVRSTVPVGTTREVVLPALLERVAAPLLAFCPERTIQGQALAELPTLPQVIGALDDRALARARELFAPLAPDQVEVSSLEAAELTKLVCNAHTDLLYGFGNEVALLAHAFGVDGTEVVAAANVRYPRPDLARPGYVGGSCLTKDPYLLLAGAERAGYPAPLVAAARQVNESIPGVAVRQALDAIAAAGCDPAEATVLVCGIAYKGVPETDDVRGSAAIEVARLLRDRVGVLAGHDPRVPADRIAALGYRPVGLAEGMTEADALILLVDSPRYAREITAEVVRSRMRLPAAVFDMWGVLADELAGAEGVEYRRLGDGGADPRHGWSWVPGAAPGATPAA